MPSLRPTYLNVKNGTGRGDLAVGCAMDPSVVNRSRCCEVPRPTPDVFAVRRRSGAARLSASWPWPSFGACSDTFVKWGALDRRSRPTADGFGSKL